MVFAVSMNRPRNMFNLIVIDVRIYFYWYKDISQRNVKEGHETTLYKLDIKNLIKLNVHVHVSF